MTTRKLDILIATRDASSKTIRRINGALGVFRRELFSLKTLIAGAGAGALAKGLLDTAAAFEDYEARLTTLTGSSDRARAALDWISEFTEKTPYQIGQVTDAFAKLTSYGFDATQFMNTLGDTAASMGKTLDQAVEAFADAATGEFERLKEFGVKARTEGDRVTFSWVENGQVMTRTVDKIQSEISAALADIWTGRFAGGMARFADNWRGMWSNLIDYVTAFARDIADAGVFDYLKNGLRETLTVLRRLRTEGDLQAWAANISNTIVSVFEQTLLAAAGLVDATAPVLQRMYAAVAAMWNGFTKLPAWVQEIGIIGAMIGGKKAKALFALVAVGTGALEQLKTALDAYQAGQITLAEFITSDNKEIQALLSSRGHIRYKIYQDLPEHAAAAGGGSATMFVASLLEKLRAAGDTVKKTVAATMGGSAGAGGTGGPGGKSGTATAAGLAESMVTRLKAAAKTTLAELQNAYKADEVGLEEYFARRKALIDEQYEAERAVLAAKRDAEDDPDKRLAAEDALYARQQAYKRELVNLTWEQVRAEEALAQKKQAIDTAMRNIASRSADDSAAGMRARFALELAELDSRHAGEIERLEELTAAKEEIDEAYRLHKLERDKLMVDQELRLNQSRLSIASQAADGLKQIFDTLYEESGEKNEALFIMAKMMAIGQIAINTAVGIMRAWAEAGPYAAPYLTAIIAAQGAIQTAVVVAQTFQALATGGVVGGRSPNDRADNVPIWATAGEYMIQRPAVRHYGRRFMDAVNGMLFPRDAIAGMLSGVNAPAAKPAYALADGGPVPAATGAGGIVVGDVHLTVQAADAQSFADNPETVAAGLKKALRLGLMRKKR